MNSTALTIVIAIATLAATVIAPIAAIWFKAMVLNPKDTPEHHHIVAFTNDIRRSASSFFIRFSPVVPLG